MEQSYADWQAEIIQKNIAGLVNWFGKKKGRVIGNIDGQIRLVFENDDFEKMREEIFTEGKNETSKEEGTAEG